MPVAADHANAELIDPRQAMYGKYRLQMWVVLAQRIKIPTVCRVAYRITRPCPSHGGQRLVSGIQSPEFSSKPYQTADMRANQRNRGPAVRWWRAREREIVRRQCRSRFRLLQSCHISYCWHQQISRR